MNYIRNLRHTVFCPNICNLQPHKKHILIKYGYRHTHHSCRLLVVGGGTGGCSMAARFLKVFDPKEIIIIEPSETHYYQPMFTLIGAGIKPFKESKRPMKRTLPQNVKWIQENVMSFEPTQNQVTTSNGDIVQYEIMIVAMGLQLRWEEIPGLVQGLKDKTSGVCSIYGPDTVVNVFPTIKNTKSGTAIFTFPNSPVKCPGAPQKIAYLAEDYFRNENVRDDVKVVYNTALPVIFGVKKYANALWDVCRQRDINVNLQTNLIEINLPEKEAVFKKLDGSNETFVEKYSLLHVCPPMGPPDVLKNHPLLTNEVGFLSVDPKTLQHTKYSNIYGIGDCTSTPNSKTMAAIAVQGKVLYQNILSNLENKPMPMAYNGYSSCPLVTSYTKCILAEFDYNMEPLESFPIDQSKESAFLFKIKTIVLPDLYWFLMIRGFWNGPEIVRKFSNLIKKLFNLKY